MNHRFVAGNTEEDEEGEGGGGGRGGGAEYVNEKIKHDAVTIMEEIGVHTTKHRHRNTTMI